MITEKKMQASIDACLEQQLRLVEVLQNTDAVLVGAGAGLSSSTGFVYDGSRFQRYMGDFGAKYGFSDMYSGGFYPFPTSEEQWAFWSRFIYLNRYLDPPKPVYQNLFQLVGNRDYFVLTTNVDHCFQKADFDKKRLFYTQGDYGLWQCSVPCHLDTYDNEAIVREMVLAQGFIFDGTGALTLPEGVTPKMEVPAELVPRCPICGAPMTMNLRADDKFVEDEGWHLAAERYSLFIQRHRNLRVLYLELGVGANTPAIIKYPFWRLTAENPQATYACLNRSMAICPREIQNQSICLKGDIGTNLAQCRAILEQGGKQHGCITVF